MSHLSAQQLDFIKHSLRHHKVRVQSQVHTSIAHHTNESYSELAGNVRDEGDASFAKLFIDFDNSMAELRINELRAIDAANARIMAGNYGECMDCGEDIDYRRLAAYPIANRCIRCQSLHERIYSSKKHASL